MSELFALSIMIVIVAYVVWPLLRTHQEASPHYSGLSASLHDLHYQKRIAREIIQDLHFDYQTGKLSAEDHDHLVQEQETQIAKIQDQLDKRQNKNSHDLSARLEAEIAQQRKALFTPDGDSCPQCGKSRPAGAKFCPECGAPLR